MGFKFSYVCDLLSSLNNNYVAKAASEAKKRDPDVSTVEAWFNRHERKIHSGDVDRLALLSCLLPEKRPERVFKLRERSLTKVIGRCLLLGTARKQELDRWGEKGWGDLGQCVEYVMRQSENCLDGQDGLTVEEVDLALAKIASNCRFSGPTVRYSYSAVDVDETLSRLFRRLSSRDAKWFTRLILKDFSPVALPVGLVLRNFHFLLPQLLLFQNTLEGALSFLSHDSIKLFPSRPTPEYAKILSQVALPHLKPDLGVKIGRAEFFKARSLNHCCQIAKRRKMSIEKKYDGEYCQIHINLSKAECIQIFSKSGKDSTQDKRAVHNTLKKTLRIGERHCRFSSRCIIECEILVWSDAQSKILPFHQLRSHISRSGSFIGTNNDYRPDTSEHLYLAFFDVLLVDHDVSLAKPYHERRRILKDIVDPIEGYSELAQQQTINFAAPDAYEHLKNVVALAAAQRWEGVVLKGIEEPYFPLFQPGTDINYGRWIKLKKEYIPGLGDSADFALIGARYDPQDAAQCRNIKCLSWTSFFVGCLDGNTTTPGTRKRIFRVVDVLGRHNINRNILETLNRLCQFQICDDFNACPFALKSDQPQLPEIGVLFRVPIVVELVGSGFERPPDVRYFTLRFPRVIKIHSDRDVEDAITFDGLQKIADIARAVPTEQLSEEVEVWSTRLEANEKVSDYIMDDSQLSSASADSFETSASRFPGFSNQQMTTNAAFIQDKESTDATDVACRPPVLKKMILQDSEITLKTSTKVSKTPAVPFTILPDHTDLPNCEANHSLSSSNSFCTSLTHLKDSSIRINGRRATMGDIPSDPTTVPTSPLSPGALEKVEKISRVYKGTPPAATPLTDLVTSQTMIIVSVAGSHTPKKSLHESMNRESLLNHYELLCHTPKLLSTSLSKRARQMAKIYIKRSKSFSTSIISDFLSEIIAKKSFLDPKSKSLASLSSCAYGIVLIDPKTCGAGIIAAEIARVGNQLVKYRRQGRLEGSGKIFFLHWKVMQLASGKSDSQRSRDSLGKAIFAGCLKWGVGTDSRRRHTNTDNDVTSSTNWQEVLPLLQPTLC